MCTVAHTQILIMVMTDSSVMRQNYPGPLEKQQRGLSGAGGGAFQKRQYLKQLYASSISPRGENTPSSGRQNWADGTILPSGGKGAGCFIVRRQNSGLLYISGSRKTAFYTIAIYHRLPHCVDNIVLRAFCGWFSSLFLPCIIKRA